MVRKEPLINVLRTNGWHKYNGLVGIDARFILPPATTAPPGTLPETIEGGGVPYGLSNEDDGGGTYRILDREGIPMDRLRQ